MKSPFLLRRLVEQRLTQWLNGKNKSVCNAGNTGDAGLIPELGRSPGEGHRNPLHYSFLENPMGRGAWQATVYRVSKNQICLKWLSMHSHMHVARFWFLNLWLCQSVNPEDKAWEVGWLQRLALSLLLHLSCPTLCDPTDCSPPGSSVHGFSRQEYWSGVPLPSPALSLGLDKEERGCRWKRSLKYDLRQRRPEFPFWMCH